MTYPLFRKQILVSSKIRVLSLELCPKPGLRNFFGISITETCYQLSSTKMDASSVINLTVVSQCC